MAGSRRYLVESDTPSGANKVFRDVKSGQFSATVMSRKSFEKASGKANEALKEAVRHSPAPALARK